MGLPSFPPFNKPRSSSGSRDSESDSDSGDSDRESSSSTSSYSPPRREWAAPHTPPHRHQQQPKRFAAPVGSVETPTPIPRGGTGGSRGNNSTGNRTNSSTQTTADSTAASATSAAAQRGKQVKHAQTGPLHTTVSPPVRPVRRRALPSSERTESLHEEHRPRHEIHSANAVPFSRQRHAAPPDSAVQIYTDANKVVAAGEDGGAEVTEEEDRRVQRVLSTAEAYLARIEDLYHRLRHRYEEVLLSPVKGDEELTGSGPPRKHPATPECRSEDDDGGNLGYPQPRRIPPSEQRYAAAPTRPPSQAASPASPTSAPLSLRHELARLESQWQRLEELKRRGIGAGAGAPFVPSSSLQPSFSSALSTTAPAPALSASSRQPARGDTVLSNQSVMELINDRKHLLTSAA
ncbi:hypothetical protein ABB37_06466 [Leptomonas pyrrhocoris]|uniref:Uncharacterized protein n=1 Tax=Leptomonas pyrrhocoris TaxID=157538 RepID=A0A0M9FXW1_LEPPY|nr:hypothetical protein ABB37_06466 [Leptomonas pyrrhocoris]KPA78335.1 hypothetical protein ABB37_06466 [Leptomonas pyrrhocoris]|eukprot:XP_015656774.1 hypothetical protein ABB37_06466 [Leptomonas pyrrhocoris]